MKFLDLNGLTHFFGKVKTWAGNNYLSLKGGSIDGSVNINNDEYVALRVRDGSSDTDKEVTVSPTRITMGYTDEDSEGINVVNTLDIQDGNITAKSFARIGGTNTQVLMADGSVRTLNTSNGIAGLDSNGYVPLAQLGNLDTTVAEVVTSLPTTNIKKHIYLIRDTNGVTQNQYEEYIYTGDTSAAYDDSKWEKLGDFRATVDLADYAKKKEIIDAISVDTQATDQSKQRQYIAISFSSAESSEIFILEATTNMSGFMSYADKSKLDNIDYYANNYSLPLAADGTRGGIQVGYAANGRNYPVQLSGEKAYVNIPWTDTTYDLSPYAKKMETVDFSSIRLNKQVIANTPQGLIEKQVILFNTLGDNVKSVEIVLEEATSNMSGLMSIRDKNKLDYIANGATADSAITTAEIDALFA